MIGPAPACMSCKWLRLPKKLGDRTCDAFPKGIPAKIWEDGDPHTEPVKGDHGIQYEAAPAEPDEDD